VSPGSHPSIDPVVRRRSVNDPAELRLCAVNIVVDGRNAGTRRGRHPDRSSMDEILPRLIATLYDNKQVSSSNKYKALNTKA